MAANNSVDGTAAACRGTPKREFVTFQPELLVALLQEKVTFTKASRCHLLTASKISAYHIMLTGHKMSTYTVCAGCSCAAMQAFHWQLCRRSAEPWAPTDGCQPQDSLAGSLSTLVLPILVGSQGYQPRNQHYASPTAYEEY